MTNFGIYPRNEFPSGRKSDSIYFVVRNISENRKRVRVFQTPIKYGAEYDLLSIPGVDEAGIRHSLLKGELKIKLEEEELIVTRSNIDLITFSDEYRSILQSYGITQGLEAGSGSNSDGYGITENEHEKLEQLIHFIENGGPTHPDLSGAFRETLPTNDPFPTNITWWTNSTKLVKIVEKLITYDINKRVTSIVYKMYKNGSLSRTLTDTLNYIGNSPFESSRTRTIV